MRQVIQQNPALLPALLQQLGQENPQLLQVSEWRPGREGGREGLQGSVLQLSHLEAALGPPWESKSDCPCLAQLCRLDAYCAFSAQVMNVIPSLVFHPHSIPVDQGCQPPTAGGGTPDFGGVPCPPGA